ncbi:cytochrome c oxidase assembly protein [Microbacterium stercoris]|uniref:Bifunctional copper resistance protein CopD/cytochrome c oxidase assembly protein n=1 Tax=Microbacterium stercoris TaxID=2820289 RepID=A0A939TM38_9MICO|nr:cytochrome c oxidase assembly protein [Microbacterium stercoris]MBO3662788.1 bifunctional copper resistance protein CopD/cytochrome c oxidase assembly protein [Microbacterium stercoris]
MNPRALRAVGPVILVVAAVVTAVASLAFTGAAAPLAQGDPGAIVRWGLPLTKLLVNVSGAVMAGSLVLALFALKAGEKEFDGALDVASIGAAVLTVAAGATGFMTFLDSFNPEFSAGPEFGAQLGRFLTEVELGRTWLITTIAAAVVTILAFAIRSWLWTLVTAVLALATLIPMATQGHSGELASHDATVTAMSLHVLGAAAWLGGLVLLAVLRPALGSRLATVVGRYSSIALVGFVIVAGSGLARALSSIGTWQQLMSPYGAILIVKVVALIAMGVLGAWYRGLLIGRMQRDERASRAFWTLIGVELAFMGIASGAAAALARTPPPLGETPYSSTPAEILTGEPLPPELTLERWFTTWDVDLLWATVAAFGIAFYVLGVVRLRRRGDSWPIYRTVLWIAGCLTLFWVTSGPVNAYQDYLFSLHMLGHMLLTMGIPLMLVPGAPITLALRAIEKRDDGTRGGREWIMWAVHSPFARVITHPLVAAGIFVGSLWVFYFTDLFRWSLYDHLGHVWMVTHFLISGFLFVMTLTGIDPLPYRMPYPGRLVTLIAVMAMHAFFGVAMMMQEGLMAAEWFGGMGRTWGPTPLEDQYIGGGVAWSIGEIPTLITAIVVAIQWSRSDERQQRRQDRHADRTENAELDAYNARLAAMAERDAARPSR